MADVQVEHGYARLANEILDQMAKTKLNGTQFRILMTIWRYTYGFQRKSHEFAISFLAKATDKSDTEIKRELKNLIEYGILIIVQEATFNSSRQLAFNKNHDEWIVPSKQKSTQGTNQSRGDEKVPSPGYELEPSRGYELVPQERNLLNISLKKEVVVDEMSQVGVIEQYFCQKKGKGLQVSVTDHQTMRQMIEDGLPIEFIKEIIDKCFKEYKPEHRFDEIRTFSYCAPRIYDEWHKKQQLDKPTEVRPFKQKGRSYKSEIPIVQPETDKQVSDEEFLENIKMAQQMAAASKEGSHGNKEPA